MRFIDKISLIDRIHLLAKRKATGTPEELADKLNISPRTVYRLIKEMKELGAPIYYNDIRSSYCYNSRVEFNFGFKILTNSNDSNDILGGSRYAFCFIE